jgi:Uma2 family endonuclease
VALVSLEPNELKRLVRQRRDSGADRFDEVWDGVYVMAPLADNEHQRLGLKLAIGLTDALGSSDTIQIFAGCNVSDQPTRWKRNYRCPDLAIFLPGNAAIDRKTHWYGGPDFAIKVMSRFDRSREKFDFYKKVGVRELLLIDRHPWMLERYRVERADSTLVGRAALADPPSAILSDVLGLAFQLVPSRNRPQIEIVGKEPTKKWLI